MKKIINVGLMIAAGIMEVISRAIYVLFFIFVFLCVILICIFAGTKRALRFNSGYSGDILTVLERHTKN